MAPNPHPTSINIIGWHTRNFASAPVNKFDQQTSDFRQRDTIIGMGRPKRVLRHGREANGSRVAITTRLDSPTSAFVGAGLWRKLQAMNDSISTPLWT